MRRPSTSSTCLPEIFPPYADHAVPTSVPISAGAPVKFACSEESLTARYTFAAVARNVTSWWIFAIGQLPFPALTTFNRVVKCRTCPMSRKTDAARKDERLDAVFHALADTTRRPKISRLPIEQGESRGRASLGMRRFSSRGPARRVSRHVQLACVRLRPWRGGLHHLPETGDVHAEFN